MNESRWMGRGPEFTLEWGGRTWGLDLGQANPGLRPMDGRSCAELLCLNGLAQVGRSEPHAFNPSTLVGFERYGTRIEAAFAPPGWGGSTVRASWSPTVGRDGVDLEVQIGATSVGELKSVEVGLRGSGHVSPGELSTAQAHWVEPRDAASAALSYDGRESAHDLRQLFTNPLPASTPPMLSPWIDTPKGSDPDLHYIEIAQPNDVARRILSTSMRDNPPRPWIVSVRYALFGHDLEKGVILRARLRGLWIRSNTPQADALVLLEEFLREPPPLGP